MIRPAWAFRSSSGRCALSRHLTENHPQVLIIALKAWVLEIVLISGTAYIGWFIWSLITWGKGQTPAQNLLQITSINQKTGKAAKRPQMFIRYFLIFATYWIAYFTVSNLAYAFHPSGILLATGILFVLAVHIFDISGIVRRSDHKRLADVVSGIGVKEMLAKSA